MGAVLAGVDGSPQSIAALRWAAWFAAATDRPLHVAHAWQHGRRLEPLMPSPPVDVGELEAGLGERLRAIASDEIGDRADAAEYDVVRGETAAALLHRAQQIGADLIVVGTHGAGGGLRALLGSVSRRLTECPAHAVAVVPETLALPAAGDRWSLVVGVDGSDGSARAVRWAADAARRGGADVLALHALEPPVADMSATETESTCREMQQRLEEEWCAPLRAAGAQHRAVVTSGPAALALIRAADDVRPAAIVLGSRGLGALSRRLLGSVTDRLLRESAWPTVVIPSPRDCVVWSI